MAWSGFSRSDRIYITLGGGLLAILAGYVNAAMLGHFHAPVAHMSGAVSTLAFDLVAWNRGSILVTSGIVLGFLLGALVCGVIIGSPSFYVGRRYGVVLIVEGLLLLLAGGLTWQGSSLAVVVAATACGLQNAMATTYRGLVVRTTHVTGVVTDLGNMLGHRLRGHPLRLADLVLLGTLLGGFFTGVVTGGLVQASLGPIAVSFAAPPCLLGGTLYLIYRYRLEQHEKA